MEYIKRVKWTIRKIGYRLRAAYYYTALSFIGAVSKTDKDKVLLSNFYGKGFGGNPRPIAEELHKHKKNLKLYWLSESEAIDRTLPDYIKPVRINGFAFFHAVATAGTWVFNQPIPRGMKKKKNQVYIQTLHGDRTCKKVYYSNIGKKQSDLKHAVSERVLDYGVTGSLSGEKLFREGLGYTGKLIRYGCPRNDRLVNTDNAAVADLRIRFGIGKDDGVLLYAPTFRDQHKQTLEVKLDFNAIIDSLEWKTGKRWFCIMRTHFHTKELTPERAVGECFINASDYPDMADLLLMSDILITDYSSSAGDFCLTGRLEVLFLEKEDEYTRSLSFKLQDSPHLIAYDQNQLINILTNTSDEQAKQNDKELIEFWGIYETGQATKAVVDVIMQHTRNI